MLIEDGAFALFSSPLGAFGSSSVPIQGEGNNNKKILMPARHQSRAYSFGISDFYLDICLGITQIYCLFILNTVRRPQPMYRLPLLSGEVFSREEGVCTQTTATLASGSCHWQPRQNGGRKINSNFVNYKIIKFSSLKCMRHPVVRLPPSLARCSN